MLRELTENGNKIKEEMKVTLSKIKKNPQGINSEGTEAGIQINYLEQKEEINIQPEQKEEIKIQINEEWLRNLLGQLQTFQHLNHKGARRKRARN